MTTYVKVSELPASTVLADADVFIYNDDTTTSKITYANLKAGILTGVGSTTTNFAGAVTFSDAVTFGTGTITGLDKADVGLSLVDNTSDVTKPISAATQSALDLKANSSGPTFTGVPSAPTAVAGTNTTQIATTAFVAEAITTDNVTDALLASPALTGTPTAPTAGAGTNTTQLATTAFVTAAITADNATDLILGTSSIDALGDVDTTTTAPSSGDFLKFDGSNFVPGLPAAAGTFELDGTTLRNVTGGHTFALRNAALANTISLNTETGGADFADRVYSTEYRAVGTGHLKLRAEIGNDLNIYLNDTETLQITRSGTDCRFTSNGGNGTFKFNQDVTQRPGSSVTPSANGDLSVEATSDTTLTFKFKGSDGVVRSGTITLS